MKRFVDVIPRGIVVSCQAKKHSPLRDPETIARLAKAAELGGAVAIRANGRADIQKIKRLVSIPVIGINKIEYEEGQKTIITPTIDAAAQVVEAGADVIALDATETHCSLRDGLEDLVSHIRERLGVPVMTDVSTLDEGLRAAAIGADAVATTLAGYTPFNAITQEELYRPDLRLLERLLGDSRIAIPVLAEGRFWEREDVRKAFDLGVYAVVIGKAITNPQAITRYYVDGIAGVLQIPLERSAR